MQATVTFTDDRARIALEGNFTYEAHRDFKQASTIALDNPAARVLDIDFGKVEYMDSAALGMLLLLKERAVNRDMVLSHCTGTVLAVLNIANFGRIFNIQ